MRLYYHKTSGGAEYLFDTFIKCPPSGHREGCINDKTKFVVRIDGDIIKDAELTIRQDAAPAMLADNERLRAALKDLVFRFEHMDDPADVEAIEAARAALVNGVGK